MELVASWLGISGELQSPPKSILLFASQPLPTFASNAVEQRHRLSQAWLRVSTSSAWGKSVSSISERTANARYPMLHREAGCILSPHVLLLQPGDLDGLQSPFKTRYRQTTDELMQNESLSTSTVPSCGIPGDKIP